MAVWSCPKSSELDAVSRWDAEAFSPFLRSLDKRFRKSPKLADLASVTHPAEIPRVYSDTPNSPLFLLAQNIRPLLPDTSNEFRISQTTASNIPTNRLEHGDVLITRSGANSGMCAVYLGKDGECYTSGEGIIVRQRGEIDGAYLAAYLNTTPGQALCRRAIYGSGQPHIGPRYLELTPVPRLGKCEDQVARLVKAAYRELEASRTAYPLAEAELLERIGWNALQKKPVELSYVVDFDTVTKRSRADAEFFQPRVQAIMSTLFLKRKRVRDFARLREENFKPRSGTLFHYIEIGDVAANTSLSGNVLDGLEAPSRAKFIVRANDVITSTVRPIRGLSGLVSSEQDGWVCSNGFAVLQPQGIPPEYLVAYLKLPPVCEVMDAHTTATMYPAISVPDLLNLPLFVPEKSILNRIVGAVQSARIAEQEANKKLELAKQLVETAINTAMKG